jgi:hypothetical protein
MMTQIEWSTLTLKTPTTEKKPPSSSLTLGSLQFAMADQDELDQDELDQDEDDYQEMLQVRRRRLALLSAAVAAIAACEAVIELMTPIINRTPYHTSMLSGEAWVQELLAGHPRRIHNELGVCQQTFLTLVQTLQGIGIQSLRNVTIEEQLAIFLYTVVTGLSSTHVGEHFQRSPSTITK